MSDQIVVRPATVEDIDTLAHLKSVGFGYSEEIARTRLQNSARYTLKDIVLAEIDGTAVGTGSSFLSQMWLTGVPMQMGAVAGVTTHPQHRNQGVSKAIMHHLLQKMYQQGAAVSVLFPTAQAVYRKVGYAPATVLHAYNIKVDSLSQFSEAAHVRNFNPDDFSAVRSVYRGSQLSQSDGRLTRSNTLWEKIVAPQNQEGHNFMVVYDDGSIAGFAKYRIQDSTLKMVEMFTSSDEAYRGLWGYLSQVPNVNNIEYLAPADDPILHLLSLPADGFDGNRGWVFDDIYHATSSFMLRVIDVAEALTSRFYPHNMMGNRVFKIDDPILPDNAELINFRIVDGRPDTIPVEGKPVDIETDIATFSQIFCGFLEPETAQRLGRLKANEESLLWLSRAMVTKPLFIHQGDWF